MTNTPGGVDAPDFGGICEHSVETVVFEGAEIGWLFSFGPPVRHVFETLSAELWDLERIAWPCPAVARLLVIAFDRAARQAPDDGRGIQ